MKAEKEHRRIVGIWIYIVMFLLIIIGGAYAVVQNISYNTENVIASLGSRPVFTSTSTNSISMPNIPYINEVSSTEYEIANATDNLSVSLSTNYDINSMCRYDIVWEWDTVANASDGYHKTSGATKEFTVSGVSSNGLSFDDVQLNDYNVSNLRTVVASGMPIIATGSTLSSQTWQITTHFYKTQAVQSAHQGKSYSGRVYVDNIICQKYDGGPYAFWILPDDQMVRANHLFTFPASGGTAHSSCVDAGLNVCIGQDASKYYACGVYDGHQVCFSQPYSQYTGSTYSDGMTTTQQNNAKAAIVQTFVDAGINITTSDCFGDSHAVACQASSNFGCGIAEGQDIVCYFEQGSDVRYSLVNPDGQATMIDNY